MADFNKTPDIPLEESLALGGTRIYAWQSYQRGIDTRSGSIRIKDIDNNTLVIGVLSTGNLGLEILNEAGDSIYNPLETDVTAIEAKVGSGVSTPTLNSLLVGTGSGTSAWSTTVAGITLTTPTISSFANAGHDHTNSAGGGVLNIVNATTGSLTVARGGTGATTASGARTNLGVAIGSDVQAYDAQLADIAGITFAQGDILYFNGTNLVNLAPGTSGDFLKTQGAGANPTWDTIAGGGDMLASTYDAAGIAQQLLGTTATQTVTNKTIDGGANTLTNIGPTSLTNRTRKATFQLKADAAADNSNNEGPDYIIDSTKYVRGWTVLPTDWVTGTDAAITLILRSTATNTPENTVHYVGIHKAGDAFTSWNEQSAVAGSVSGMTANVIVEHSFYTIPGANLSAGDYIVFAFRLSSTTSGVVYTVAGFLEYTADS